MSTSLPLVRCPKELKTINLKDKVIIITGGYAGIGLVCSTQLLKQGATVIVAGRNHAKFQKVLPTLADGAVFMKLDLSDMNSVKTFASEFSSKYTRLDVLYCNAGVMMPGTPLDFSEKNSSSPSCRTKEGYEIQMAANYIGHFLLIQRLLPVLETTENSRIVMASSCAAEQMPLMKQKLADIDLTDPFWKSRKYNDLDAYAQSKLSQILHMRELSKQLKSKESNVKVVALHPGWGDTELFRHADRFTKVFMYFIGRRMGLLSPEDVSEVPLYCILSDDIESGQFYSQKGIYTDKDMQKGGLPLEFKNENATEEKQKELWQWTLNLLADELGDM